MCLRHCPADVRDEALDCRDILKTEHFDYFIFGHRHLPIDFKLQADSRYINLGDWIRYYTYAVFDGSELRLTTHLAENESKIVRIGYA